MFCLGRPAPAKAGIGHIAVLPGLKTRLAAPTQARTQFLGLSQVPVTRPGPRGSCEKNGLFPLVSTLHFTAPHVSLCLVKIDSVLTVSVCTQIGRKKQPGWRDPTAAGFITVPPRTQAAKARQPCSGFPRPHRKSKEGSRRAGSVQ